MIDGLKPYAIYKNSGLRWIGEIPSHWDLQRAKWLFRRMDRPVRDSDEVVTCFRDGTVTLRKNRRLRGFTESLKEIGYQGIRRGDLVIHAMDAFAGAVGVSDSDGKGTPVYSVCEPASNANANYYAHLIGEMARSQWILALATGIRERSTDFRFERFASQMVPLPPLAEQNAIVRFLGNADRQIKRYIRAKKMLIGLLNEQRQKAVKRAITRGVDPAVSLKSSGVEWIGDIPQHWQVKRLKWAVRLQRGYDLPSERRLPGPYPVVSSGGDRFSFRFSRSWPWSRHGTIRLDRRRVLCGTRFLAAQYGSVCYRLPGESPTMVLLSAPNDLQGRPFRKIGSSRS